MNRGRIYPNVTIGKDCRFDDYSCIGLPPRGYREGELPTLLGDRVHIHSHAVICCGNTVGDDFVGGHGLYMRLNDRIGNRVRIGALCILETDITIEDDVTIGPQTGIADHTVIERGVLIGAQVGISNVLHPLCPSANECASGPHIQRGVTIGGGVTISPDLRMGQGAYVEPGSVVVRDVRPYAVVAGNPAKEIGDLFDLYPGVLERVGRYIDASQDAASRLRARFEAEPSRFPYR